MRPYTLKELLLYTKNNVGFYSSLIPKTIALDCNTQDIAEIFMSLPTVDKQQMKHNIRSFFSDEYKDANLDEIIDSKKDVKKEYTYEVNGKKIIAEYSSGTTGVPSLSIKTINERLLLGNQLWKLRNQICSVKTNEFFNFIHNFGSTQYPFPFPIDPYDTEQKKLKKELDYLSNSKYKWWHINTYRLSLYSDILNSYPLKFNHLKVIENNGSYVSESEMKDISNIYNCRVVNNYGCREVWTIAFDCPCGYLHVNDEAIVFELFDDSGNIIEKSNIVGNVVITSLCQSAMPFIRYKTGDQASYLDGSCECGKIGKRVKLIPGRSVIYGTDIYGNIHFRSVIRTLLSNNDYNFDSIDIVQTGIYEFNVHIKTKTIVDHEMEDMFKIISNNLLKDNRYQYVFSYNSQTQPKSIFTVAITKNVLIQ